MSLYELDDILNELEERKSTHNNISTIWINYLKIKKQKLEEAISETKILLNNLNNMSNDLSPEMIQIMVILMDNIRENRNTI